MTVIGPAWKDTIEVNVDCGAQPVHKRRASAEPELQPPARRGPALLGKLKICEPPMPTDPSSSRPKSKGKKKVLVKQSELEAGGNNLQDGTEKWHALADEYSDWCILQMCAEMDSLVYWFLSCERQDWTHEKWLSIEAQLPKNILQ
jgi:hypothetical protein